LNLEEHVNNTKLGRIAFTAYRERMNNTEVDGSPIPEWGNVSTDVQMGWIVAAIAVKYEINDTPMPIKVLGYVILTSLLITFCLGILFLCYKALVLMGSSL
jgi:hypothetical protein